MTRLPPVEAIGGRHALTPRVLVAHITQLIEALGAQPPVNQRLLAVRQVCVLKEDEDGPWAGEIDAAPQEIRLERQRRGG